MASTSRAALGYHCIDVNQFAVNFFSDDVPWLGQSRAFCAWPHSARLRDAPGLLNGSLWRYPMLSFAARASVTASRPKSQNRPPPEGLVEQYIGRKAENDARPYQHQCTPWNENHGKRHPHQKPKGSNSRMSNVIPCHVHSLSCRAIRSCRWFFESYRRQVYLPTSP